MTTDPAAQVVEKLTEAQKRVILSLPMDGAFGPAADSRCARRMFYGVRGRILIHHQHMANNAWCLSPLGKQVRALLLKDRSHG